LRKLRRTATIVAVLAAVHDGHALAADKHNPESPWSFEQGVEMGHFNQEGGVEIGSTSVADYPASARSKSRPVKASVRASACAVHQPHGPPVDRAVPGGDETGR